jgi:hypothetical protein
MTSRYELDFDVGGERLAGEVTVELTGLKVDLALGDVALTGFIDDTKNSIATQIALGSETLIEKYTRTLQLKNGALVVASYVFQLDEGDMPLVGQIFYKADAYRYKLSINGKKLEGTGSARGVRNVYQIGAVGLTRKELSLFLLVNLLKAIHLDQARYYSSSR